jgi:hypothetical protein
MAQLGFAKALVNHEIPNIHDEGVMAHLIKGPYIMFFPAHDGGTRLEEIPLAATTEGTPLENGVTQGDIFWHPKSMAEKGLRN